MQSFNKPTMISLFAGAGGLDIGLEQAGFRSIVVNEIGSDACESLRKNKELRRLQPDQFNSWFDENVASQKCYMRGDAAEYTEATRNRLRQAIDDHLYLEGTEIIEGDIRGITGEALLKAAKSKKGDVFLVAGGPPCQPFSRAGKRETVETGDGKLFLDFVRVVNEVRPRWFLFENVKGLTQSKTTVPFVQCKKCGNEKIVDFENRTDALLNQHASNCFSCGCPDTRIHCRDVRGGSFEIIKNEFERIGYKCYSAVLNAADYGVPQSRERLFIVGSRDQEEFVWPEKKNYVVKKNSVDGQLEMLADDPNRNELVPWLNVREVLWKDGHRDYGKLDYSKAVLWVKNVVRPHDEPVTWSLDRISPTIGAHQGAKLALAPYGVPQEQLARQQWHVLGRRQGDMPPVPVIHSMLTDEELLVLQTFPANWYLHGTRMERAFQIGNAVPPMLAKAVGQAILKSSEMKALKK